MRIIAFFLLNFCWLLANNARGEFTLEQELPPIKITYGQLFKILDECSHLISKYDTGKANPPKVSLVLQNESTSQTFEFIPTQDAISIDKAFHLNYQYSNYEGKISKVDLWLRDYGRSIKVTGENITEVQSIVYALDGELRKNITWFGGIIFRTVCFFLLVAGLIYMGFEFKKNGENIIVTLSKGPIGWISIVLLFFAFTMLFDIYGFDTIFPGFTIYHVDTNFIVKNADYFTFGGFVLTILTLLGIDRKIKKLPTTSA